MRGKIKRSEFGGDADTVLTMVGGIPPAYRLTNVDENPYSYE
jgi:ADP-ribosylglycohydrolase